MGSIYTTSGAHHFRCYSSVDISNGKPLGILGDNGKPLRKQQSVMLVRQDDGLHSSKKSTAVLILANQKVEEIEAWEQAAANGEPRRPDGNMLVRDFFLNVFMPYVKAEKEASTAKSYLGYWNAYLEPHFNHSKTLKGYESYMGTNFLEQLCKKYSENTVMHARALASAIFSYATAKGYIKYNAFRDVKKTSTGQDVEEGYAYSQKEIERIIEVLDRVSGREEYSATMAGMAITVAFYAGLRPSEIAGLRWENVTEARIHVRQAYVNGNFKGTKTGKNRSVNMLPTLQHQMRIWAMTQQHPKTGWVFPNQSGDAPINMNDLGARVIADTLKESGLDWQGFYACRRGFGTMLVLAGATLDEVADAMGNSPDVVFKHYFKDKDSRLAAKGMAKLAAAMAGETEPTENERLLIAGGE